MFAPREMKTLDFNFPCFSCAVHPHLHGDSALLISLDDKQQLLQHYDDDDDVVDDDDDYISETVSACKWLENCIFKLVMLLAQSPPIILESEEKSHSLCSCSSTPQLIDLHTSVTQMSWTIGHEPEVATTLVCVRSKKAVLWEKLSQTTIGFKKRKVENQPTEQS